MGLTPLSELLHTALHDLDFRRSQTAAQALLRREGEMDAVLAGLAAALRHTEALVRRRAAQSLAVFGERARPLLPPLTEVLRDGSWTVREAAAQTLGRLGLAEPLAREALVRCTLHDRNQLVRIAAAQALTQLGGEITAAVDDLRSALRSPAMNVRKRAVQALACFAAHTDSFLADLEDRLRDSHLKVREATAAAVGQLGGAAVAALPGLIRRLHDQDTRVHVAAAQALARIADHAPPALQPWLTLLVRPGQRAEEAVSLALNQHDLPETVRREFTRRCDRRAVWHENHGGEGTEKTKTGTRSAAEASRAAAEQAEWVAVKQAPANRDPETVRRAARAQEYAWQLACLCELLQTGVREG
jgi:HEAT repeat protein